MTRRATKRAIARQAATIGAGVFDPEEVFPGCVSPQGPDWKALYADTDATRLLGGVVVLLPSHRDITVPESSELLRKQAAALREFADAIDAVADLPVPSTKGVLS